MEQEKKIILTIDTGGSEKTVKSLKKDISDLKDAILNLEKGTKEYDDAVEQLQESQRQLNEVQALTKKTAVALDGSYDALVHKMSLLKKEWRATADEARRAELGKEIDEINTTLKEMDATIGNHQRNVGNYEESIVNAYHRIRKEIKEYQAAVLNAEEGTEEWEEAMRNLANAQFQLRDMNEKSRYSVADLGEQLSNVTGITSGLMSGFSAVQASMVLFGASTEKFEKVMIKLQASMAIVQGMQGLEGLIDRVSGLTTAIKTVTKAMSTTGWIAIIMAVVSAVAIATSAIRKKREEVDTLTQSLDKLEGRNNTLKESDNERARQLERDIKLMQAQGATEKDVLNKRLEYNQLFLDASKRNADEARKQYLGLRDSLSMGIKGVTQEDVDRAKEIYDNANETYRDYAEKRKDILNDIVIADIKAKEQIDEVPLPELPDLGDVEIEDAEITVDADAGIEKKVESAKKAVGILNGLYEQQYQRELEYNRMSEADAETKAQREYEINLELQEKKLDNLKKFHQKAIADGDVEGILELAEQIKNQELAIDKAKYDEKERLRKADEEKEKEHQETVKDITNASFQTTSDLLSGIAELYEADGEVSEKEANKVKALRIAEATINTIQGAIGAYTQASATIPPPMGQIIGGIQAAAVTSFGMANIQKIRNTDVSLKGGSSGGITPSVTPNVGSYSSEIPASYSRNITTSSEIDELNASQRVYILESDIQESNRKVSIRETESSF